MSIFDSRSGPKRSLSKEDRVRLMSELSSPYRGIRKLIYFAAGSSAGIGAFVFFFRVLAGRELAVTLPSLALQLGVLAAMIGLFKWESRAEETQRQRLRDRIQ